MTIRRFKNLKFSTLCSSRWALAGRPSVDHRMQTEPGRGDRFLSRERRPRAVGRSVRTLPGFLAHRIRRAAAEGSWHGRRSSPTDSQNPTRPPDPQTARFRREAALRLSRPDRVARYVLGRQK